MHTANETLDVAFQFHKGTIKTILTRIDFVQEIYFNSIKVRLKPVSSKEICYYEYEFQFHKGTIKTHFKSSCVCSFQISIP